MSELKHKHRAQASPTPEAHRNRDARGPSEPAAGESVQDASAQNTETSILKQDDFIRVKAAIEALLLASQEGMDARALGTCLPEVEPRLVKGAVEQLKLDYSGSARGIHLVEVAGGFQLRTNPAFKTQIQQMFEETPRKLSRAAMETLAIVAYRQPLTRADVEELRGVDSSGVIRTLEDHQLVETIGRLDDLGRPHIYGTTRRFLEFFGLDNLADLPVLSDQEIESLDNIYQEKMRQADTNSPTSVASSTSAAGPTSKTQQESGEA